MEYGIISFDDSNFDMEFFLSQCEVIVDKNIIWNTVVTYFRNT